MRDALYITVTILFFIGAAAFARGCESLENEEQ